MVVELFRVVAHPQLKFDEFVVDPFKCDDYSVT
jgi:hypothetical protein